MIGVNSRYRHPARYVVGPDGAPLTLADLPPKDTIRWVVRKKAQVVAAIEGGLISVDEACQRYSLSLDELLSWKRMYKQHGLNALKTTRTQEYRV